VRFAKLAQMILARAPWAATGKQREWALIAAELHEPFRGIVQARLRAIAKNAMQQ
jgi:hypothetical protein